MEKELSSLDPKKSAGSDGLDPMFLKAAAPLIAAPVATLFNLSLQHSSFPADWKAAMVFPLFKGGTGSDPNCYRPISILPCLAKVLEKLALKQLNHFLTSSHILSDLQSGFRPGHGCMTAIMKVLDDITTAVASKLVCLATFIDLAKAFDSVEHNTLLQRLSSIGLSPSCCDWFASYLTNRVQQVKSGNTISDPLAISKGVPQGSILGPTLFSIYINEVAKEAGNSRIHLYADDTILYAVGPSIASAAATLQESLNNVEKAFHSLHLRLNTSKTKCMLFSRKKETPSPPKITCADGTPEGATLEFVDSYKYLGIWLDSSLSFNTHINNLQSKVKARLAFLFRNKSSFTHAAKHILVKMTVLPILDYGDIIYRAASDTALKILDTLHHSAIRFATNAPYLTHHHELYEKVDWSSLETRRSLHWHHFIYKTLLGKMPPYLSSLLSIAPKPCNTRASKYIQLTVPSGATFNTDLGRTSFRFAAAYDWNTLQSSLKLEHLPSLPILKQYLQQIFFDCCACACPSLGSLIHTHPPAPADTLTNTHDPVIHYNATTGGIY